MMEKCKKILLHMLFPPPAVVVCVSIVAFPLMIVALTVWGGEGVISYISFALAFYALLILSVRGPAIVGALKKFKAENPLAVRYFSDVKLRADISLYGGLSYGIVYALFQLALGIIYASFWYYTLSLYYLVLVFSRFYLLRKLKGYDVKAPTPHEWKIYRNIGILLGLLSLCLSSMVFFIVYFGRTFVHHEIIVITLAAYTFTSLTVAIINVVKYRKYQSPLLSSLKAISLVTSLVSLLTLECAMLTAFDTGNGELFRRVMTGSTGAAVVVATLAISAFMTVKGTKFLKINKTQTNKQAQNNNDVL